MHDEQCDRQDANTVIDQDIQAAWVALIRRAFRRQRPGATDPEVDVVTSHIGPRINEVDSTVILLAIRQIALADVVSPDRVQRELRQASIDLDEWSRTDPRLGQVLPFQRPGGPHQGDHHRRARPRPLAGWEAAGGLRPSPAEVELLQLIAWLDTFRYQDTGEYPDWQEHACFREVIREYLTVMPFEVLIGATRSCAEMFCVTPGVVQAEVERWYNAYLAEPDDEQDGDVPPL